MHATELPGEGTGRECAPQNPTAKGMMSITSQALQNRERHDLLKQKLHYYAVNAITLMVQTLSVQTKPSGYATSQVPIG